MQLPASVIARVRIDRQFDYLRPTTVANGGLHVLLERPAVVYFALYHLQ